MIGFGDFVSKEMIPVRSKFYGHCGFLRANFWEFRVLERDLEHNMKYHSHVTSRGALPDHLDRVGLSNAYFLFFHPPTRTKFSVISTLSHSGMEQILYIH